MTPTFEAVRDWAAAQATSWALDAHGMDRLRIGTLEPALALRIEAFNLLMPIGMAAAGIGSDLGTPGLRGLAKRRGVDRAARAWALRWQRLRDTRNGVTAAPSAGTRVLLLAEFSTPSMLEPMRRVAAALPPGRGVSVIADPRAVSAFRGASWRPLVLPLSEERAILQATSAAAAARWRQIRAAPPRFLLDDVDVTPQALAALEPLVRRSLPWLAAERAALTAAVAEHRPSWVVVASDQHRLGRMAVEVARSAGARTLVLQHGVPQYDLGYVPVAADVIATWSEADDAWFRARGTAPDRFVQLGNPRLDDLVGMDRATAAGMYAGRPGHHGHPRLLVALSPNDRERNLALIALALGHLATATSGSLIVKLHPGDGRWTEVRERIRDGGPSAKRVRVFRREALLPLLAWADAVLLHRSTVAVEALAAGTPVLVAGVGPSSPADALPDDLDLPTVRSAAELTAALAALEGERARTAFLAERLAAIQRSTGTLDGKAAARIAEHLMGSSA